MSQRSKRSSQTTMRFFPFSKKQLKILTWWTKSSPYSKYNGIIADGSIRSGKTCPMAMSFVFWGMDTFDGQNFGLCAKSTGTFKRNVWIWLKPLLIVRGMHVQKLSEIAENCHEVTYRGKTNYFYIFGGKDERSADFVQGITLAGIYFDEVALMPESFVNKGTSRCSAEGAKLWFNCNPEGPMHWFKVNWIDQAIAKKMLHIHFTMDDNPSLSEEVKNRYLSMYIGVFFQRFILGLWVIAQGAIYDMFTQDKNTYTNAAGGPNLIDFWYQRYYAIDKGTVNPTAFLEIIEQKDPLTGITYHYVENEYYYDSLKQNRQKEDHEYADDLVAFIGENRYLSVLIDPSAANFKLACRQKGIKPRDAINNVRDGIMKVASLFALGRLKVNRENCPNLQKEIASYTWDTKACERGEEKPIKKQDHAADCLRYYVNTIVRQIRG